MVECNSIECNSIERRNIYRNLNATPLNDQQRFRLNKNNEIKIILLQRLKVVFLLHHLQQLLEHL